MGRRGSISFVIEVKRSKRRFPLAPGRTDDPNGNGEVRFGTHRPSGLALTPFSEGPRGYDPTVEAAKVAADRLFNRLGGSASTPTWSNLSAPRTDVTPPEQPAGLTVPGSARDASATPSPSAGQSVQPRTGRILESLTSANPLEALFRQKAEERAAPRERRPRAARSTTPGETQAAGRSEGKHGSASKSAGDAKDLLDVALDTTDPKQPRRSRKIARGKTRRIAKALTSKSRRKRKSAVKSRARVANPMRADKRATGLKRNSRNGARANVGGKRGSAKKVGRKVLARKVAPNKAATRKTAARKAAKAYKVRKTSTTGATARGRASTRRRRK